MASSISKIDSTEIGKHLSEAFSSFGFVYIINHGLAAQDVSQLFRSSRDFFQLPLKQKRLFQRQPTHPDRVKAEQGFIEQNQERLDALKKSKSAQQQVGFPTFTLLFFLIIFMASNLSSTQVTESNHSPIKATAWLAKLNLEDQHGQEQGRREAKQ